MCCPMIIGKESLVLMFFAKVILISWFVLLPFMILWRLDRIIKLLEKK